MIGTFKEFISNLVVEELHPELQDIIKSKGSTVSKKTRIANKIKDLSSRNEKTGIEGNMPSGSSRAYLKHEDSHTINLDGKPVRIPVGTKVAIKASLDSHHSPTFYDDLSLGALQNRAEGGDHFVNSHYRVLREHPHKPGHFKTNHDSGIFPPLIDHDHENHEWTHVGHCKDVSQKDFKEHTKCESHPKGISHKEFCDSMNRFHERNNGKYWEGNKEHESKLDHIDSHPLVQKFQDYHGNTGHPTYDYQQIKNMGVFHHPDGHKMIVARDHGYDTDTQSAYVNARKKKFAPPRFY